VNGVIDTLRRGRIRVVATDIDGTLMRGDGTISARTRAALRLADTAGAAVMLVTARPVRWLDHAVRQIDVPAYVICSNGTVVYDLEHRTSGDVLAIASGTALTLAGRLRAELPELAFGVESPQGLGHEPGYVTAPYDDPSTDPGRRVGALETLLDRPIVKLLAQHPALDADTLHELARAATESVVEASFSGAGGLLEMGPLGVTKASTLARWCARRGIGADEVVAFGDMPNDLPMLLWAGLGYAVANCHPRVRAAVGHVCAANDADGVAEALESIFS
jgi:Cof subfamily protein (haloacid dehalogenase superfamily)